MNRALYTQLLFIALSILLIFTITCEQRKHTNPFDPYYVGNQVGTVPIASFTATPDTGYVGTTFTFNASASTDAQDPLDSLMVRWDWESDNTWDTQYSAVKIVTHAYTSTGDKNVKLQVKDTDDQTGTFTRKVVILATSTGQIRGSILDAVSNAPVTGVNIQAFKAGAQVQQTTSQNDGTYQMTLSTGSGYSLNFTKTGYMATTYDNVTVEQGQTLYLESILQISNTNAGVGTISGTILNAVNGQGIPNVTLKFRAGINARTGSILATTTTDATGAYQVNLNAGNYTAEASHANFTTTYLSILCIGNQVQGNQNSSMTSGLSAGEWRFVLTWGDTPNDLDSHLTGPISGSADRFHVYYSDKGRRNQAPYDSLDWDDTYQFGPETISIYQQFSGVYRYSVHNFSNRSENPSTVLSESGARVSIYQGNNLVRTFNVPNSIGGTLWTVFELSGSSITPINTMTYVSSPDAVTVIRPEDPEVDPVFKNYKFPAKD